MTDPAASTQSTIAEHVLDTIGDRAEATVQVVSSSDGLTRFANSFIHQNVAEDAVQVVLSATVDRRSATATSSDASDAGVARLVERLLEAARLRPPDPHWPGLAPPAETAAGGHWDDGTASASPSERATIVGEFVAAAGGLEAAGFCSTKAATVVLANSAGVHHRGRRTMAALDGIARTGTSDGSGSGVNVALAALDGSVAGATAAAKAHRGAVSVDIEPGTYEVVLEPACVASILDFLAYLGFNAKAYAEGRSFAHPGEAQFDASVNVWDDATDPRTLGLPFDAEGTPTRRVDLVRGGTTVGLAYDRRAALQAGTESTGHSSGDDSAGPVPLNLILGEGDRSPEELVGAVERGLLITEFHYIRILDPKTQVTTGNTRNGVFLIEHGEIKGAVSNMRFTQSFVAALGPGKVLGIGNDARPTQGHLGGLLGTVQHVPSLHLAAWNFTGGAKG